MAVRSAEGAAALIERLEARRPEIEQTILTRVHAVDEQSAGADPEYALGLKAAVSAAVSYGLAALERRDPAAEPIPPALLVQARRAAQMGVGLDTVLRRYVAGHALLDDFIVQEARTIHGARSSLGRDALRIEALVLDHLIDSIAVEYNETIQVRSHSRDQRRIVCVRRLLAGELTDATELHYDLAGWHLALVARGPTAARVIRDLAAAADRHLLLVQVDERDVWAWLGGRRPFAESELLRLAAPPRRPGAAVSIGEPGHELAGWRLTHLQGRRAMPIALRDSRRVVLHREVALAAAALRDEVLAESLRQAYLIPLEGEPDGGRQLRTTLRAYLAAKHNVSSAAAALGVSRQTVSRRVCAAEEKIGQSLDTCPAELETALRFSAMFEPSDKTATV